MAIVGSVLFGFYSVVALMAWLYTGNLLIVAIGTLGFIGFQYKLGKYLALKSVGAEEMPEDGEFGRIHDRVEGLSRNMNIDKPRLMVASMGVPNAFAVGRKGAGVVVVSRELIHLLEDDELDGVIAHELAHIKNRDVVMMVLGQSIASLIGIAAQFAVLFAGDNEMGDFFLAIIVGNLVQLFAMIFVFAISRYREYVADADAAEYVGSGEPLARALQKIQRGNQEGAKPTSRRSRGRSGRRSRKSDGVDDKVSALCIFGSETNFLQKIFSTHPPTEERIERLRA